MKLALNYSDASDQLVKESQIDVDLFKCPDWPDTVKSAQQLRPIYVHFPLKAGHIAGTVNLDRVAELKDRTGTKYVNTHLDPELGSDAGPISAVHRAVERTIEHIDMLAARFGIEQVIVENVPYWEDEPFHERLAALPDFINTIVEETGCGLLLDLAHARIAARELDIEERTYLQSLPTDRLRELHVNGVQRHDGWLRDHMPLTGDDWDTVDWALRQIQQGAWARPDVIALEYGGIGPRFNWRTNPDVLVEQVPRLREMMRRVDSPSEAERFERQPVAVCNGTTHAASRSASGQ